MTKTPRHRAHGIASARKLALALALAALPLTLTAAGAATLVVDTSSDTEALDGFCSLREAILAANLDSPYNECPAGAGADRIHFALPVPATIVLTAPLPAIVESVAIRGPGAQNLTLDGDVAHRILTLGGAAPGQWYLIEGLGLTRGHSGGTGGAVLVEPGATALLSQLTLLGNVAGVGGGAVSVSGTALAGAVLAVDTCHFEDNLSLGPQGGGALHAIDDAVVTVHGSSFVTNRADHLNGNGGAIAVTRAELRLERSTVSGNTAVASGGGVFASGSSAPVHLAILDSTLYGNHANIFALGQSGGGGVAVTGGPSVSQFLALRNSIVAGNTDDGSAQFAPDVYLAPGAVLVASGFNLIGSHAGATGAFPAGDPNVNGDFVGTELAPIDALLQPLGYHGGSTQSHRPFVDAATRVIDHGNCTGRRTDQRGFGDPLLHRRAVDHSLADHPASDGCDIGAFERGASPFADPAIFADGFELGHALGWSAEVP